MDDRLIGMIALTMIILALAGLKYFDRIDSQTFSTLTGMAITAIAAVVRGKNNNGGGG